MHTIDAETCQSRGRGFKSRRARHRIQDFGDSPRGLSPKRTPRGHRATRPGGLGSRGRRRRFSRATTSVSDSRQRVPAPCGPPGLGAIWRVAVLMGSPSVSLATLNVRTGLRSPFRGSVPTSSASISSSTAPATDPDGVGRTTHVRLPAEVPDRRLLPPVQGPSGSEELPDCDGDGVDRGFGEVGKDREGKDLAHHNLGPGQARRREVLDRGLTMARDGIVDPGLDPSVGQKGAQGIAARRPDHVEVIYRLGPGRLTREDDGELSEGARVTSGEGPPPRVADVEPLQEHSPGVAWCSPPQIESYPSERIRRACSSFSAKRRAGSSPAGCCALR